MNFKAILFDMDGVLWLTNAAHSEAYRQVLDGPLTIDEWAGRSTVDVISRFLPIDVTKRRIAQMARRKQQLAREILEKTNPVALGAIGLLAKLSRTKTGLVSSASPRSVALFMSLNPGMVEYFNTVIDGNMVELCKPAPDAYHLAAQKLSVSVYDCLAVEDSAKGAESAARAGAVVCGVLGTTTSEKLFESGAHFVVPTLVQLIACLGL